MSSIETKLMLRPSWALPQAVTDGAPSQQARGDRYSNPYISNRFAGQEALADEGSTFTATNATPGAAVALNANVTAFSDTNALFVINNTESTANPVAKRIFLDSIKLFLTTAPTATQSMEFAFRRSLINREPTAAANRTVLAANNLAGAAGRGSIARVLAYAAAGAMTIPASGQGDPIIARERIPTGLGIVGDEYYLKFGGEDQGAIPGTTAVRASSPARIGTQAPQVIVEPGEWLAIHMWWLTAATTAAAFEYALKWFEF